MVGWLIYWPHSGHQGTLRLMPTGVVERECGSVLVLLDAIWLISRPSPQKQLGFWPYLLNAVRLRPVGGGGGPQVAGGGQQRYAVVPEWMPMLH